jgi:hypothetical protein
MIRNLKALGLALGAVFALGAAMASSASAVDTFTTAGKVPAIVTGEPHEKEPIHIFEITGEKVFKVECQKSKFHGTITNGASKVTIYPTYTGSVEKPSGTQCDSTLGVVTVDMNGCTYDLTGETTGVHKGVEGKDATVWISCPPEKEIKITGLLGCTVSIHPQTPTEGGVVYTNEVEPVTLTKDIKIHATVTGITFSSTNACTLGKIPTEGNNADYKGTVTAKCYKDIKFAPPTIEEGEKISCEYSES